MVALCGVLGYKAHEHESLILSVIGLGLSTLAVLGFAASVSP